MANETQLRNKQVSTMIKKGFISDHPVPTIAPEKSRSIPKLLEMMNEMQSETRNSSDNFRSCHEKIPRVLKGNPIKNPKYGDTDLKLSVISRDGFRITMDVHRQVLVSKSRFFADKLKKNGVTAQLVEICECDDVEVYMETIVLMYCDDLKKKLRKEQVTKVLGLLKVSDALMFDGGIRACLEHLEAIPWSEDEEYRILPVLSHLNFHDHVSEVLQRVSFEPSTSSWAEDIFLQLLLNVLQAKDEKARRELKIMISRLFKEESNCENNRYEKIEVSSKIFFRLFQNCIGSLIVCLREAIDLDESRRDRGTLMADIAREVDNLHWILDILIERKMGDDAIMFWANQTDVASLHSTIQPMFRFEISRITSRLCTAIGKGQILASKQARLCLLHTWLEPFYQDFELMTRACRSIDRKSVEDELGETILTLPLKHQQIILLDWFDRYLNKGSDLPNIQKAFEVWWRRTFVRQYAAKRDDYTEW